MTDYIGAALAKPGDLMQYGRRGMKWGQRIFTKGSGKSETSKSDASTDKSSSSGTTAAKRPPGNIQDNVESSSARYDRLAGQAKAGRAHEMTEQDLKFFNARTEALAKVNKMNEEKPSWLRETATKVIQQSAQRQMQTVADALADKYVGDPIKQALKGATDTASAASAAKKSDSTPDVAATAKKTAIDAAKKVVETTSSTKKTADPKTMRFADALQYFKDNPSETPVAPDGYSPNATKLFYEELKKLRGD